MISKNIGYIRKLDHLRFFAALLVGIYHFYHFQTPGFTGWAESKIRTKQVFSAFIVEGHTGVALFMVLSGFIFAAIGYKRDIIYRDFVINRILRIVPLFGVAIFVAAALSPQGMSAFVTSFLFPVSGGGGVNYAPITPHLWTIRTEFQFYLLFPFLIMFVGKYGMRYAVGLLTLMMSIRGMIWWSSESAQLKNLTYWSILGRLDQFVIGMLAGCVYSGRSKLTLPNWLRHWSTGTLMFSVPLGCVYLFHRRGGYWHLKDSASLWICWPDLEALAWAVFVIAYVKCELDWPEKVSRLFAWLGMLSFSIYVNHWLFVHDFPAYRYLPQLTKSLTINAAVTFTFVLLPILAAFSWLTYQIIERPFIEMRRSYLRRDKDDDSKGNEGVLLPPQ